MKFIYLCLGLMVLQPALAGNQIATIDPACQADAARLCAKSSPEKQGECLSTQKYALSETCAKRSDQIRTVYRKVKKIDTFCYKDYGKFCGGLKNTPMNRYECILKHIDHVSPACQKGIAKIESSK